MELCSVCAFRSGPAGRAWWSPCVSLGSWIGVLVPWLRLCYLAGVYAAAANAAQEAVEEEVAAETVEQAEEEAGVVMGIGSGAVVASGVKGWSPVGAVEVDRGVSGERLEAVVDSAAGSRGPGWWWVW